MHIYMYHEYTHMLYSWYTLNICIYNHNCMHNIAYTCIEHIYNHDCILIYCIYICQIYKHNSINIFSIYSNNCMHILNTHIYSYNCTHRYWIHYKAVATISF